MTRDELLRRIAPDQRLLLRAALCADDVSRAAFGEWRDTVRIEDLPGESHRLLPLLARRMADVAPHDPVRARVRGVYRHAWVKNRLIMRDAAAVATRLHQGGVRALALKGAVLIGYYGDDWGTRPMYDVDLLVPVGQVRDAFRVLLGDGWMPRCGISEDWLVSRVVPRRHSFPFSRELEEQLDLHWHVLASSLGATADERFWAKALPFDLGGASVLALRPPDLLLHVLAHGARATQGSHLQWVSDAVHVLRACDRADRGEGADRADLAGPLAAEARRHGLVSTARAALEAIDVLLDEPLVRPLLTRLAETRPSLLERVAEANGGSLTAPARSVAQLLLQHGGGREGIIGRASGVLREGLDLDFVNRPSLFGAYALSGRRRAVARLGRRAAATFARTSAPAAVPPGPFAVDFTDPIAGDRHAGPGWWAIDDHGLWSHGSEARVVLDVADGAAGDVELHLDARSYDQHPRQVEVRVNEEVVARVMVGSINEPGDVLVHVPAKIAWRFRPMEIALLAAPKGGLRRGRVSVRLLHLRLTPSAAPA